MKQKKHILLISMFFLCKGLTAQLINCLQYSKLRQQYSLQYNKSLTTKKPPLPGMLSTNDTCTTKKIHIPIWQRLRIAPFCTATSVQLVSFKDSCTAEQLSKDTLVEFASKSVFLHTQQWAQISNVLYNHTIRGNIQSTPQSCCFHAQYALVFYEQQSISDYLVLDIEKKEFRSSRQKTDWGDFCEGKYQQLARIFKSYLGQ